VFIHTYRLPTVKHVFYDHTHKDRSPSHKFLNNLDKLIEMGKVITDEELAAAKGSVQPDHDLFYTFSSVMAVVFPALEYHQFLAHRTASLSNNIPERKSLFKHDYIAVKLKLYSCL